MPVFPADQELLAGGFLLQRNLPFKRPKIFRLLRCTYSDTLSETKWGAVRYSSQRMILLSYNAILTFFATNAAEPARLLVLLSASFSIDLRS